MTRKPLKTELHHWWPRTLADYWSASDGMVSVIRPKGDVHRAPPGAFGAITNAHHMKLGGPWDTTFEPQFNQPDGEMSDFVDWISTLNALTVGGDRPMLERIVPQLLCKKRQQQIARVVASILARSPCIRHSIKIGTEYSRRQFGLTDPTPNKNLIAANQCGLYDAYRKRMEASGRWAVVFSDEKEFITGDGFLHNFPASQDGISGGKKLVLPILPTATIIYMLPTQYPIEPKLVTVRASADEVTSLNKIVQVYAKDFLFFREEKPELIDAFKIGQHRIFEYHGDDWLDSLLDDLSQYNLWGPEKSAGMSGQRPYSENLQGNRWLESFVTPGDRN